MTGHKSLREVERYVAAASKIKRDDAAMARVNQEQNWVTRMTG